MKKIKSFAKSYPLVFWTAIAIIVALGFKLAGVQIVVNYVLSGFALFVAAKLGLGMIETLRHGHYGIDILAVMAIISTVLVGEHWAAIVIVLMLTGGEALEDYAAARARRELTALLKRAPQIAHKVVGKDIVEVKLAQVRVGDVLLVRPGEVVPVDAELLDEAAEFDESSLTGESLPVERKMGDGLLSGSINGGEAIKVRAIRAAKESQYQQIIELVKAASSTEAPFVRLADRYAVPFTVISFVIAGFAWAIAGDPVRFAEVLVVATPCPLLLAAPIALISGMSRAAKHGIIVKSGGILERLATIQAVAFDKTGTLTKGEPTVTDVKAREGFTADEVIKLAASAEQHSTHILANSLVTESKRLGLKLETPGDVSEVTAQGMTAKVGSVSVLVGKPDFLKQAGVEIAAHDIKAGETVVYVAVDNKFAGVILFRDEVRTESKKLMQELKNLGIRHTLMLTGDTKATAERIAKEVGISEVRAECLPIDKVNAVRNLKTRPVMMVGDGVNDAPVLAVAEVGMAMGARGSTAASETADVVVLVDDISKSAQAIMIAKNTIKIALQSIWVGIAISIGLMIVAANGYIPAVVGAGLQEVVDVIVIFNALRAHGTFKVPKLVR